MVKFMEVKHMNENALVQIQAIGRCAPRTEHELKTGATASRLVLVSKSKGDTFPGNTHLLTKYSSDLYENVKQLNLD